MKRTLFLVAIAILAWLFCSEYNPFDNPSNVSMSILADKSPVYRDSAIAIFTTETLTVAAAVREKIDSFTIAAEGNKYWRDTTVCAPISSDEYTFLFSYPDTGIKKVFLKTYRDNGDIAPLEFSVTVYSPLTQDTVDIEADKPCTLSTPPVGEPVTYAWSFGQTQSGLKIIASKSNSYTGTIEPEQSAHQGYVWVFDSLGNLSPKYPFYYNFIDTSGPKIYCINEGVGITDDTVITGSKSFIFKIECHDIAGVGGAHCNSTSFDDSATSGSGNYTEYYKTLHSMDTVSAYIIADIRAWDRNNKESSRTFFIRYDISGPKEIITIIQPPTNPYTTSKASFDIIASVDNPVGESVIVSINHIESSVPANIDTINANTEADVLYTATLKSGSNTFVFSVFEADSSANILDKDTQSIILITGTTDTTSPYINRLSVNGKPGDRHYVAGNTAILELEAFDENMSSVVINGKTKTEAGKYIWRDTLALTGSVQLFAMALTDASKNQTLDTVWVQKNSIPEISPLVYFPKTLVINRPWSRDFTVADLDHDTVGVTFQAAFGGSIPPATSVNLKKTGLQKWVIYWTGAATNDMIQTSYKTELELFDKKQKNKYPWNFTITDSTSAISYIFKMMLPPGIDTTASGHLDLSFINVPVTINCALIAQAKPLQESDTITVIQPGQAIKFPADAGDSCLFSLTFNPREKEADEKMMIAVIDKDGIAEMVDTVSIIYKVGFPAYIDSLGWMLRSDTGIKADQNLVIEWSGITIKLTQNTYTNSTYGIQTMPQLIPAGAIANTYPVVHFTPKNHSNLIGASVNWITGPFTLFFVAKLDTSAVHDTANILASAGPEKFIGLGVFKSKMGATAQSLMGPVNADSTITCDLTLSNNRWYILCFASERGIGGGPGPAQSFVKMWLDGKAGANNTITFPPFGGSVDLSYLILGGGAKHLAQKNWNGGMANVIKYSKYLNDEDRMAVVRYLAWRYKINISNY